MYLLYLWVRASACACDSYVRLYVCLIVNDIIGFAICLIRNCVKTDEWLLCICIWLRDQKCATDFTTWISHHSIYFGMFDDSRNCATYITPCAVCAYVCMEFVWQVKLTSEIRSSIIMPTALFALFISVQLKPNSFKSISTQKKQSASPNSESEPILVSNHNV